MSDDNCAASVRRFPPRWKMNRGRLIIVRPWYYPPLLKWWYSKDRGATLKLTLWT